MLLSLLYRLGDSNFANITEKIIELAKKFVRIFPTLLQPEEEMFWPTQYCHHLGQNPSCLNTPPTTRTLLPSKPTSHTIMSLDTL